MGLHVQTYIQKSMDLLVHPSIRYHDSHEPTTMLAALLHCDHENE